MATIASSMSVNEREASLKGKDCLALGFVPDWLFQCFLGREVYANTEQLCQAILDGNHIHQRESSPGIKLGNNIHVRRGTNCRASGVRAMQEQMDDTSSLQLRCMLA